MSSGIARSTRQSILNHLLKTSTWSAPSALWVGLFTVAPGPTGGGTEVSSAGGSLYTRVNFETWNSASAAEPSVATNNGDITFAEAGTTWGAIVAFGIFTAQTVGTLLAYGACSKTISSGDTAIFLSGTLQITLDATA
jgi:hypothetical protein